MEDLAADFIIENNQPLELEAEISEPEHFDCVFELNAAGTTWGSISGTLSNQTDLQAALDLKADKSEVESVTGALADSIQAVDNKYDSITSGLDDSITAIDNKYDSITGALDDKIDSINGALSDDIDALESITGGLSDSISAIDSTIGGYGDIVTYNAADFATSIQGGKADTALQPNDNISELYNDAGYITSASLPTVNDGELTIKVNGSSIATFTANQGTDTIADITVPNSAAWGNITGTLSDQTDLQNALDAKVTNNATGTNALALGNTSQSTAEGGVAVGYGARANSTYATAVGEDTRANNTNTTVIGRAAKATEARAIAIGSGAEANAQDAIAIKGINNTANTFQVYTYNMLDMSNGLIPDARISSNIARTVDIPSLTNYVTTNTAQTISQTKAFSQPLVIADNNGLASGTLLSSKKILQRVSADNTLILNNIDNKLRLIGSETRPKYSTDGTNYSELALYSDVTAIDALIPAQASSSNQLADKNFVNSSIATNTANFIGTFNSVAELEAYSGTLTNNDYAFVVGTDAEGNTVYDRYKYTDATTPPSWIFEYELNNSSFTAAQWDAINSGITSGDVALIGTALQSGDNVSALVNDAGYITSAALPTDYYTKSEIDAILPQPTKVPIVYYQPTDSYCYTESNNRFYGSHVFEKLYLVQPKTSGTTQVIDMSTTFSLSFTIEYQKAPSSAVTVAEIMTSYAAGKGVLLQLNSTGLYYKNNVTGTTITGTRALTAGNSYDVKAEYDGTHMIISYKLSSDANYTQINSTTCTCDGSNYNYAAIGMNADNGNMSLSSVVLTNGADTLYSYTAGKIALDYDGSTLKLNASNQLSVDFTGYATETWVGNQGYLTSGDLTNYVTTNTAQTISAKKTFTGEKAILFKQTSNSDKLGFTLYNSSNTELGAFEYRPNTISGKALLNVNCSYAGDYVGFRYWGTAVNVVAPKVATAGTYYIPINITDGNTTVTAANTGTVNISSLLPDISGKQNTLTAGSNITISGDTISATDTTYSNFTGADSVTAGASGLVPAPAAGDDDKILTGGATWNELKTVNSTSLLGNGNIDTSDIFIAQYGVTSYTDINAAYTNGKMIFCKENDRIYPLQAFGNNSCLFVGEDENGWAFRRLMVDNLNEWNAETTYFARSDLGNVTNILADSVVANKDLSNLSLTGEAKFVNTSGDTMTGALVIPSNTSNYNESYIITNQQAVKGTNPTTTKYWQILAQDSLNDFTAWNTSRLGNLQWSVDTSGDVKATLNAYENTAGSSSSASFVILRTKAGVSSCSFPQTNCVDGQWVAITQDLISTSTSVNGSSALGAYTISNIPNDGNSYEVLLTGTLRIPTGNNYARLAVYSSKITSSIFICQWQNRTSGDVDISASCIIPVTSNRNIWVVRSTSWNGTVQLLRAVGYRRIGTNT